VKLGYTPINARILDLDEAFKLASELELQFLELTFDMQEMLPSSQPVKRVLELTRSTGVGVTVHLSFVDLNLASLMPGVRENSVERTQRGLEYAEQVGAICGVLHSGLLPMRHPLVLARAKELIARSLFEITPLVPIALENLALTGDDVLRGVHELEAVTNAAGAGFGNCIDVGHALIEGTTTELHDGAGSGGLENGVKRLESYLTGLSNVIHFHLQDNDGHSDQHLALGRGKIPWQTVRSKLEAFTGTVNLEVGPDANAVRESVRFLRDLMT
jgi:sugar phosphate isomerase/epimerase